MSASELSGNPEIPQGNTEMTFARNPVGDVWSASWPSSTDKTYFLQHSTDLNHWEYSPEIHPGTGQTIKQGFQPGNGKNFFVRRISTDDTAPDPQTADFDHDGFANIVELQRGSDPFTPPASGDGAIGVGKESVRLKLLTSGLPDQQLVNGQILGNSPFGTATVVLSNSANGEISGGELVWGGGISGSYRGLLTQPTPTSAGRAAIATFMTTGQGDMTSFLGFTANGSLSGLNGTNSMTLTLQRSANNNYNRLFSNAGSSAQWVEMTRIIDLNTPYRAMVRRETNGFSSWIQGGLFANMGAKINSAVWFPVARWKGVNPTVNLQAGLHNSWVGPIRNSEFSDIENPAVDATSALLDYERNKLGLHVPSLLQLQDGAVLAAWQNASSHESADCVIKMSRRDSRGVWGPVSTILAAGVDGTSNNGPVLHQSGDRVWLTYQSVTDSIYTVRKRDVMITGAGLILLTNAVTLFDEGLVLNHSLTLPSGRIIAGWHTHNLYWKNRISYSDDQGLTWKPSSMPVFANRAGEGVALIEADGTLASYWRTDQTAIYRSTSNDNGMTWTALARTEIPCANMPTQGLLGSRISGFKRPSDGKIVIIGNNSTSQREKLTVWLVNNGVVEGSQSLFPWDVPDGSAEGVQYPDLIVHPDDSMTVIFSRWLGGSAGSAELHSAINTFKVAAAFE